MDAAVGICWCLLSEKTVFLFVIVMYVYLSAKKIKREEKKAAFHLFIIDKWIFRKMVSIHRRKILAKAHNVHFCIIGCNITLLSFLFSALYSIIFRSVYPRKANRGNTYCVHTNRPNFVFMSAIFSFLHFVVSLLLSWLVCRRCRLIRTKLRNTERASE